MNHPACSNVWTFTPLLFSLLTATTALAIPYLERWPHIDRDNDAHVLPESITPTHYTLSLVPDIKSRKFHGEVTILGQTDDTGESINRIVLNADELRIRSVDLLDVTDLDPESGGRPVDIRSFVIKNLPQWLVINLSGNLSANADYQLTIKFSGYFGVVSGMYHASYDDDYTKIGGDVALTEFQTTYARRVFPCWDEPKYKASFIVRVARYAHQMSLSNMPLLNTSVGDPDLDDRVWDTFEESPDMSTYLVAVIVADLRNLHDPTRNLSIWTQPGKQHMAQYALDLTGQLMDVMEEYTSIEYTLPKLDQVALPKLRHQAMEHWGVIAFSERFLVVDDMDSLKQKQQVAFHISHELAHQWFGNLVTMEWWNYVWLNEGFAEFFQYFLLDMLEPDWRLMEMFVVTEVQSMLTLDTFLLTHPVTMKSVRTVIEIEKVFDSVSYCKGGALVRMLYHIMTPELFQKAMRDYLQQNSLKSVTEDDLWDSLSLVQTELELDLPTDIAEIMYFWTHEPGFPLLMVERDVDGSINLTQKRFLLTNSSGDQSSKGPRWWIPLSYTTSTELDFNDTRPREWFNASNSFHQVEINLDDDEWILFNIQLAGYYRVNYDPKTWNLIIDDLVNCEFLDIHPLNRAQLLDDAFALASGGYVNYSLALNLSQYLAHETDIIPWTTAFDIFKSLEAKLIGTPARPLFRRYIQMLVSNWFSTIKFEEEAAATECATKKLSRMTVVALACGFGHHGCVDKALKQVYLLMSQAEAQIPSDLEDILLCTAVNAGPEEVWQFVRKQYMSSTSRKKRESYLEAMACSQDPKKIMQMLEDSLDVKSEFFKNNEGNTLIGALVRRKTNSETMLNFFYKNAQEISALYGPEDLQNYFMFATMNMNPIQIDELHSFLGGKMKDLDLAGIQKGFSIEKYLATMKQGEVSPWYASYYHDIYKWLQNEENGSQSEENSTITDAETVSTPETTYSTSTSTSTNTLDTSTTSKSSSTDYATEEWHYSEHTTDNGMSGGGDGEWDYDDDNDENDEDNDNDVEVVEEPASSPEKKDVVETEKSSSASILRFFKVVLFVPVIFIVIIR